MEVTSPPPSSCIVCLTPTTVLLPCQICHEKQLYCSAQCEISKDNSHSKFCLTCTSCGVKGNVFELKQYYPQPTIVGANVTSESSSPRIKLILCVTCQRKHDLEKSLHLGVSHSSKPGWVRGGGPTLPQFHIVRDGAEIEMNAYSSSEDEDDFGEEKEDLDDMTLIPANTSTTATTAAAASTAPSPVSATGLAAATTQMASSISVQAQMEPTLFLVPTITKVDKTYSPISASGVVKASIKDLKGVISSKLSKSKEERLVKLRSQVQDTLSKVEDFTADTCQLLDMVRQVIIEKQWDENKVSSVLPRLRERLAAGSYFLVMEEQHEELLRETDAKLMELKTLELSVTSQITKQMLDKKQKEADDLDKQVKKLQNEEKNIQSQFTKLEAQWQADEAKATKELASLRTPVTIGRQQQEERRLAETQVDVLTREVELLQRRLLQAEHDEIRAKALNQAMVQKQKKDADVRAAAVAAAAAAAAVVAAPTVVSTQTETTPAAPVQQESASGGGSAAAQVEECMVCFGEEDVGSLWPCTHLLCQNCMQEAYREAVKNRKPFQYQFCPGCRQPISSMTTFGSANTVICEYIQEANTFNFIMGEPWSID